MIAERIKHMDIKDLKKKLVVINQKENRLEVPDRDTLKQLVLTLENQDRKYFIVEI